MACGNVWHTWKDCLRACVKPSPAGAWLKKQENTIRAEHQRHQSGGGRHSSVTATATGDKGRYCKAGNQYGKTGNQTADMDGRLRVSVCRHRHSRRRLAHPNHVIPRSCSVSCHIQWVILVRAHYALCPPCPFLWTAVVQPLATI